MLKGITPRIELDLKWVGRDSKIVIGEEKLSGVQYISIDAASDNVTTATFSCIISPESVIKAEVGRVQFNIIGLDLPDSTRREIYELLKAEFEPEP